MKQYKAVLIGAGNRGCVYSDYSKGCFGYNPYYDKLFINLIEK